MTDEMSIGQGLKTFVEGARNVPDVQGLDANYHRLEGGVDALAMRVERLKEKLNPVLIQDMPERATSDLVVGGEMRESQSPLANLLDKLSDRLEDCWTEIDDLLTRCEL